MPHNQKIQIIAAPSILGLAPGGVAHLPESLLGNGLADKLKSKNPVINVPVLNHRYSDKRDPATHCLNPEAIHDFSVILGKEMSIFVENEQFVVALGGDCSILISVMSGLKSIGNYGLIFLDAHADFYEPEKSTTGQVADMDLAIVTGRGPEILTNIHGLKPYVKDENVVHIGQRDGEETRQYGSQDIKETKITCFDLQQIRQHGIEIITDAVLRHITSLDLKKFWIHFDTDVLDDAINPAVDYRLPGGLSFAEAEYLLHNFLLTGRMAGMSITIFNPDLDTDGTIASNIVEMLGNSFGNHK
jgi:arginase